jgi:hypothetical protein
MPCGDLDVRQARFQPAALAVGMTVGLWAAGVGPGFAGNGNTLYLVQDSGAGGVGESFQSDQTRSSYSSIGSSGQPVLQSGSGDSATLQIVSDCGQATSTSCGHIDLTQNSYSVVNGSAAQTLAERAEAALAGDYADNDGTLDAPTLDDSVAAAAVKSSLAGVGDQASGTNSSMIVVTGPGSAAVTQFGAGNIATLTVSGANGSLNQVGLDNNATVDVNSGSFTFNQIGQGNSANLSMTVPATSSATYTQVGINDSWGSTANPVTLFSTSNGLNVAHYGYH